MKCSIVSPPVLLLLCLAAVSALLSGPLAVLALAQEPSESPFTDVRELIREHDLDAAEASLRHTLERDALPTEERAEALDLLVETLLRAPYPDFETATTLAREVVAFREENLGPDDRGLQLSYRQLGSVLDRSGQKEEALSWFNRAVEQVERNEGPDSVRLCAPLNSIAVTHMGRYEHDQAVVILTRAIELCDAAEDTGNAEVTVYLANRAKCYRILGSPALAEADLRRSIEEHEIKDPPDQDETANSLFVLTEFLLVQNRPTEAIEPAERGLALVEEIHPADHPQVAKGHRHLGWAYREAARFDEARVHLERAVEIREIYLEEDPLRLSDAVLQLAKLEDELGNFETAQALQERCIELAIAAKGPEDDSVSVASSVYGEILAKAGLYVGARRNFERSLAIDTKLYGEGHPYVAGVHMNIAVIDFYAGDYAAAERGFAKAEEIYRAALPEGHPQIAVLDLNFATVLGRAGQLEESRRRFESALPILTEALGATSPDLAVGINDYGKVLYDIGEIELARVQLERALAIRREAFGESHPDVALSLNSLANLEASAGDVEAAVLLAEQSVAIYTDTRGPAHPWTGKAMQDLATLWLLEGENLAALELAMDAERAGREHVRLLARGSSERQTLAYAAARARGLDVAVASALALGDGAIVGRVWDEVIRSRALVLDEMASRHWSLSLASDEELLEAAEDLRLARLRLAGLTVRGPGDLDAQTHAALLLEAAAQKEAAERRLASSSWVLQAQEAATRVGWAELRSSLPDRAALVAYVRYRPGGDAPPRFAAFVVWGADAHPELVDLGEAAVIEAHVQAWRLAIQASTVGAGALASQAEASYRDDATPLRRAIWDPVEPSLGSSELVFVVPDGVLHLVNPNSLPAEGGGYLVQSSRTLHVLSAERDLSRYASNRAGESGGIEASPSSEGSLLAIGGPSFEALDADGDAVAGAPVEVAMVFRGASSACGGFEELRFEQLPQAELEARGVVERWESEGAHGEARLLTLDAATEGAFKEMAPGSRTIHAATHGFFLGGDCLGDAGRSGWNVEFSTEDGRRAPENPLLLSGLALAGANRRGERAPDAEDGILTAEEIAALDLSATDWVVLSACDTGLGHIAAGEGVFGLRRSFEMAGSRTLITSLWPVDDASTRQWMEALYEARLEEGLGAAAATRAASLGVLEARQEEGLSTHPFFWAPFVASGDWQ